MAKGKSQITSENIGEWMASTGFLFPTTITELERFRKLYSDTVIDLAGHEIDPDVILGYKTKSKVVYLFEAKIYVEPKFRMAARKGEGTISKNIMDKIKKNQDNRKKDDIGGEKD